VNIRRDDILTPANAVSAIGLMLSVHGAANIGRLHGVIEIGLGRLLDVIDGPVARRTHSSRFGAVLDAVFDKLAIAAIAYQAWRYGIAPKALIGFIVVQNLANSAAAIYAEKKNLRFESSTNGKYTILLQNLALGGFALANVWNNNILEFVSLGLGVSSIPLGIKTTIDYLRKTNFLKLLR
jgi:phosphatidylglycerophosphate synthase